MKTGLLWVTHLKDLEWFRYSAASYKKFAAGNWTDAKCLVPTGQHEAFEPVCQKNGIKLIHRADWPTCSFNWHQMMQCDAETLFPGAEAIWHMDADCVFTCPSAPEHWMHDGKIIVSYYTFEHRQRVAKGEPNPGMWKSRVDCAIGGDVKLSTMTGHPHAFYRNTYVTTRREIERHTGKQFDEYILGCENTYPQGFCEFETLGAIAQRHFAGAYEWRNLEESGHPSTGRVAECWSHGGLDLVTPDRLDGVMSPRALFDKLGLEI